MSTRQQDFWSQVQVLLQSVQAGAAASKTSQKLNELVAEFGASEDDVATALQMIRALNTTEQARPQPLNRSPEDDADG